MTLSDVLVEYWPIWVSAAAGLIWFIRLEGKVAYLDKMLEMQQHEIDGFSDMRQLVIQIKNDIEWIKRAVEKQYQSKKK